ncbi:hypothetical protein MRX96_008862 [Rhipicephalus microplus]
MGEEPKQAEKMVTALSALHNFLTQRCTVYENAYCGPGFADSVDSLRQWRLAIGVSFLHSRQCNGSYTGTPLCQSSSAGPDAALPAAQ